MADSEALETSAQARARGNKFYKAGKLLEAEKAYKEAVSFAPKDALPLSNLSAVAFEKGHYPAAISYLRKALVLAESEADDNPKKQRMHNRLAKCYLYSLDYKSAETVAQSMMEDNERDALLHAAEEMKTLWREYEEVTLLHRQIMDRLPRCQPLLEDIPEYFPTGHDDAESLFDDAMQESLTAEDDVSFLFCGSGDARNVFETISDIAFRAMMNKKEVCNKVHITIVDHKPAILAKTLIMFDMILWYGVGKSKKLPNHVDIRTAMAYIYACQVIPPYAAQILQAHLDALIERLEQGSNVFPFLHISTDARPAIIRVLRQWQQPLGEAFSVPNIRTRIRPGIDATRATVAQYMDPEEAERDEEDPIDRKTFDEFMILLPPDHFLKRQEPALSSLGTRFKTTSQVQRETLDNYIDINWKTNATLIDVDSWTIRSVEERNIPVGYDPREVIDSFSWAKISRGGRSIDILGETFDHITLALLNLADRLCVEVVIGEMSDVMERIRFNALDHRNTPSKLSFPQVYDRIHMSNIPDYVGGHLAAFIYGRPLLCRERAARLQFNNLLNPPMFETHQHFESEYILMHNGRQIADHFAVRRIEAPVDDMTDMMELHQVPAIHGMLKMSSFMRENYMVWESVPKVVHPLSNLLPRSAFETWMYSHLLKICLPFPRPILSDRPVHAPLNLTAFIRLVVHMSEVGYPSHWLSAIITSVCDGVITTNARAPRTLVIQPEFLAKRFPSRQISVQPWRAEYTTLFSIWRRILPFGIVATSRALVPVSTISQYTVSFPSFTSPNGNVPHFIVLFWNTEVGGTSEPPSTLRRPVLLDDELGAASSSAQCIRKAGIHCLTAFRYATKTRTATFWLRDDVVKDMMAGEWKVYIWRTDTWQAVTKGVEVATGVLKVKTWTDS